MGIVINPHSIIHDNVQIYHQVTIGGATGEWPPPEIGNNVFIGAGAKVIGSVKVGDNARVGANAVVVDDVPSGVTVVGVPARPVQRRQDKKTLKDNE